MIKIIAEDFGFDFRVNVVPDRYIGMFRITDNYGAFIPVDFKEFLYLVDEQIFPQMLKINAENNGSLTPQQCYYKAVYKYCELHSHNYIGLN